MPYSSVNDIKVRMSEKNLIEITQDNPESNMINESRVSTAILDADSLIDFFLSSRYNVPLAVTPGIIKQLSINIAIHELYKIKYDGEMPVTIVKRYEEAIDILRKMESGDYELTGADKQTLNAFVVVSNMDEDDIYYNDDILEMM